MTYEIDDENRNKILKCLESQIEVRNDAQDMIDMFERMLK